MITTNIILLALIILVIYFIQTDNILFFDNNEDNNQDNRQYNDNILKEKITNLDIDDDELINDVITYPEYGVVRKQKVNPNFLNIQFHNDYRDVITSINHIIPDKKQFFNLPNIPVTYTNPAVTEVQELVDDFVKVLNSNITNKVSDNRNVNTGWNEAITDPTIESGWEKFRKSLGLPVSIYNKPTEKSTVKLIRIDFIEKRETDDEINYIIDLILQKLNTDDQIALKCSFLQDKRGLLDEDNFFITYDITLKIVIEEIFISGYYSKHGNDHRLSSSNLDVHQDNKLYYDYDQLEINNLTDPKHIQKVLMDNYKKRSVEMQHRNSMLDEEGQLFHQNLPHIYDYSNIKGTQTIFDDMNSPKKFD
jgi:hypothetical protein